MRRNQPKASSGQGGGERHTDIEVIFEFVPVGEAVKVCAVDTATGTEISIVGPASASTADLERVALAKLRYVMGAQQDVEEGQAPAAPEGKGWVV